MYDILVQLLIAFIGSVPALFLALWVERQRMPRIEISAGELANSDNTYTARNSERWKFFRVAVKNKPFRFPFAWIPRQTAENCKAKIEFSKLGMEKRSFSMLGRWASTPELPHVPNEVAIKLLYPDPVTVPVGESEFLDVITKCGDDTEAYAWNNEAYVNNWRTPKYKLDRGKYLVKISISTQNGKTFTEKFELTVSDSIEDTLLNNLQ